MTTKNHSRTISVLVNEQSQSVPDGMTVGALRDRIKPGADVLVVNGFPGTPDGRLQEGDEVVLIRRGEIPQAQELKALMVARHTPGVHRHLKASRVGIAGLGGLGSAVTIALARVGIGSLILADYDVVEPSNLNRQHYAIAHLGMPKTDAMAQILAGINPYIQVITHNVVLDRRNIPQVFRKASIVVECFDRPEDKAMLIEAVSKSLPDCYIIGASGLAGYGDSNSIKTRRLGERVFIVGDLEKGAEPGRGLMAPRVGIAAHHQANLVVSLAMGSEDIEL